MSTMFGGSDKKSQAQIVREQEAVAKAEREKIAQESAISEAKSQEMAQASMQSQISKRQSMVSGIVDDTENQSRRKFLKAA